MIVFHAQGGLGNQLFQYATARRMALQNQCSLVVDHSWFKHPSSAVTPRPFQLSQYPLEMRLAKPFEIACWAPMRSRCGPYVKSLLPLRLIRESGVRINREVMIASSNTYLYGYWQSELYFADIREKLLKELTPLTIPGPEDLKVLEIMRKVTPVSLHVRRGDYVTLASANKYHGVCTLEYYRNAIQYISKRIKSPHFFVFSDDPLWTKANLQPPFPTYYVDHNTSENAFQDLRLMSFCRHHILANSSFSLWGAWLSRAADGLVIAPQSWFSVERTLPDLLPSRWIQLEG